MKKLKHFLSLDDFVNEYIKSTPKIHDRINEGLESLVENIYNNIINITDKTCLVINDVLLAMELEKNKNTVYCLYYDDSLIEELKDNEKYQFVNVERNLNKISVEPTKNTISEIFDNVWDLKNVRFDFIFNISPSIDNNLPYTSIADLNAYICCYPFMSKNGERNAKKNIINKPIIFRKGHTCYYSFDESHVMDKFEKIVYGIRGISITGGSKINNSEWIKFGFDDKTTRYLTCLFVEGNNPDRELDKDEEVLNNRNKESIDNNPDEEDFNNDVEIGKDESVFTGMSEPKIYAFESNYVNSVLKNRDKGNSIKVGDTNRTVSTRINEWRKKFNDAKRLKSWDAVIKGCGAGIDGKIFRDYTIHKILVNSVNEKYHKDTPKIEHVEINEFPEEDIKLNRYSNEFFRNCTTKDVDDAIEILIDKCKEKRSNFLYELKDNSIKNGDEVILPLPDDKRTSGGFVDRDIQKKTIQNFIKALNSGKKKMLMYAVMRFGKTYVACRCAQEMAKIKNNRLTVIATAKPGVKNEWTGTVNPNSEFAGFDMYDATGKKGGIMEMLSKWAETATDEDGNPEIPTLERYFAHEENKDRHIMLFVSLQDLFGDSEKFKTTKEAKENHRCFYDFPVDLLIIDECHYGTQSDKFGHLIQERVNPKLSKLMKTIKIDNAVKLYLSGTPYNLIIDADKFLPSEIISTYGFMDIIEAKKRWDDRYRENIDNKQKIKDEDDPNYGKVLTWEDNPYFGTPELLEYGYNLKDFNLEDFKDGYNIKFEDLFHCHKEGGKFAFDNYNDVKKIFEILDGSKKEEGVLSFLDVDEIKKGNMCKNIVIVLPNVNCCDALEDLLDDNRDEFVNFSEYRIIKAASKISENEITTERVKKLINSSVKSGNKTITLTCDRLLTGVTIKPWDTMFFMKDCSSAQEYDQAKFRIMTPYVKKVKSIDINEEGLPVAGDSSKVVMKPQVLFIDFHPDRVVSMTEERYRTEIASSTSSKDEDEDKAFTRKFEEEKGSITLLLLKDGKFVAGTSSDMTKIAFNARERNANAMSFDGVFREIDDKLSNPTDEEIKYMLEHNIRRTSAKGTPDKIDTHIFKDDDTATESPADTKADGKDEIRFHHEKTDTEGLDKKSKEYKVIKERINQIKECRKTIVKSILMYLLLMNRGVRSSSTKEDVDEFEKSHGSINTFPRLYDSFNHYNGFQRKDVKLTHSPNEIPEQMRENDKIICAVFCKELNIDEPNYNDAYDVSDKVIEIHQLLKDWASTLTIRDRLIVTGSWRNMQIKYKKLEEAGTTDFESLKSVLSNYTRLGKTEIITPQDICPKLFENVVIFNRKDEPKILDVYGGKIGEIFNEIQKNDKFKGLLKENRINSYYLICRTKTIAELNFFVIKNYLKGDRKRKRQWFNEHILVYDCIENISNTEDDKTDYVSKFDKIIKGKWGDMKFDVIVGNPPYNKEKHQIYPIFYKWAIQNSDYVSMIFPSGWQEPKVMHGVGLMNTKEIKYDKQIVYIDNITDGFNGVAGAKNTNIICWKKGYDNGLSGKQLIYRNGGNPKEVKLNISKDEIERLPEIIKLVECLGEFKGMDNVISGNRVYKLSAKFFKNPIEYGLPNELMNERKNTNDIRIFGAIDMKRVVMFVDKDYPLPKPSKECHKGVWKVLLPNGWGGMDASYIGGTYSNIYIANPTDICTSSFLESGYCKDYEDAKKHAKYCMSKFARALLMNNKFTHNNTTTAWKSVPVQDYSEDWWETDDIGDIDEHLFDKYDIPEDLREFVRKNIQPRTIKNIINYNDITECEKRVEKDDDIIDEPDETSSFEDETRMEVEADDDSWKSHTPMAYDD